MYTTATKTEPRALHALALVSGFLTTFHFNTVLRAYVASSNFRQAIRLFDHSVFRHPRFAPDNYTFPIILKACSASRSLDFGRRVHDLIRRRPSFTPNAHTNCALIDMFAKCGSLPDARMVFDEMPHRERDLASWTAIICGSIHSGQEPEALRLFKTMRRGGARPDSALVAAVIPACGRIEARGAGMSLQGSAWKSGIHGDLFVSNALVDMYCKFGETHQAHIVFSSILRKDSVSYGTLISGYSLNGEYDRSLELYSEMKSSLGEVKPTPNAVVMASVLPAIGKLKLSKQGKGMHGFIMKRGFDSDIVVGISLMEMYSSCGLFGEMEILLTVWSDWDIAIWNSAIVGHENPDLALRIFRKIWGSEHKPNSVTLVSILPLCTKTGAIKQGMEVHCYAVKNGYLAEDVSVSVSNSLVDMYCKCGHLDIGIKVFDQMMEKDVVSYNTVISAYGFYGYAKQALILFEKMRTLDIEPTKTTFVGLLSACSHAGFLEEGRALYRSMISDYGLRPNMEHYSCMVDLLGRAGRVGDALDFIRRMPERPDSNVVGCLLAACRVHSVTEVDDVLEEILGDEALEDSGYLILVSNMYASRKKWKDASRVRGLIKEKGLRKKPGHSWIQIGHCTHVFDARDTAHSEFCKMKQVIEILLSEMKEEGSLHMDT